MKFLKSSILAVAALSAVAFTACSDDDQYKPGDPSNGLFFEGDGEFEVGLPIAEDTYYVNVYREGIEEAATYKIEVTGEDSHLFTFANEVTFQQGEKVAKLNFSYNAGNLVYGENYTVDLAFGEGVPVCAYGSSTVTLILSLSPDFTEFQKFGDGTCTYIYALGFWSMDDDPGLPISYRYDRNDETQWQVLVEHWVNDVDLYINYDKSTGRCTVPFNTETGVPYDDEYGMIYFTDLYTFFSSVGETSKANKYKDSSTYDPQTGLFSLMGVYYMNVKGEIYTFTGDLEGMLAGYEYIQVDGFPNYVSTVTYEGVMTSSDLSAAYAMFTYDLGKDVEKFVMYATTGTADDATNAILSGDPFCTTVNGNGTGSVRIQLDGSGDYTFVGIPYGDGEPQTDYTVTIKFTTADGLPENDEMHWPEVGTATFIDGWILPSYLKNLGLASIEAGSWEVKVRESERTPGFYRITSPWTSEDSPLYGSNSNVEAADLYIDARNPECVIIDAQYSGFTNKSGSKFYIANYAGTALATDMTEEEIAATPYNTKLADNTLVIKPSYYEFAPEVTGKTYNSNRGVSYATTIIFDFDTTTHVTPKSKVRKIHNPVHSFSVKR